MEKFKLGDFVFAKSNGSPYWPGKIYDFKQKEKQIGVYFYGTDEFEYINCKHVVSYKENEKKYCLPKQMKKINFSLAIHQIHEAIEGFDIERRLIRNKFSTEIECIDPLIEAASTKVQNDNTVAASSSKTLQISDTSFSKDASTINTTIKNNQKNKKINRNQKSYHNKSILEQLSTSTMDSVVASSITESNMENESSKDANELDYFLLTDSDQLKHAYSTNIQHSEELLKKDELQFFGEKLKNSTQLDNFLITDIDKLDLPNSTNAQNSDKSYKKKELESLSIVEELKNSTQLNDSLITDIDKLDLPNSTNAQSSDKSYKKNELESFVEEIKNSTQLDDSLITNTDKLELTNAANAQTTDKSYKKVELEFFGESLEDSVPLDESLLTDIDQIELVNSTNVQNSNVLNNKDELEKYLVELGIVSENNVPKHIDMAQHTEFEFLDLLHNQVLNNDTTEEPLLEHREMEDDLPTNCTLTEQYLNDFINESIREDSCCDNSIGKDMYTFDLNLLESRKEIASSIFQFSEPNVLNNFLCDTVLADCDDLVKQSITVGSNENAIEKNADMFKSKLLESRMEGASSKIQFQEPNFFGNSFNVAISQDYELESILKSLVEDVKNSGKPNFIENCNVEELITQLNGGVPEQVNQSTIEHCTYNDLTKIDLDDLFISNDFDNVMSSITDYNELNKDVAVEMEAISPSTSFMPIIERATETQNNNSNVVCVDWLNIMDISDLDLSSL